MAERDVLVCGVTPGHVRLRLLGSACDGCSGGCAGRCSLFAAGDDGELDLPRAPGDHAVAGEQRRLHIDDERLRTAAWRGYGRAWLGLLAGTAVGHATGLVLGRGADALALAGALAGTFLAVRFSKRQLPVPHLLPTQAPPPSLPKSESR